MSDNLSTLGQTAEATDRASDHQEPEWFYMDGVPGQGPKPDYLEPKYKSLAAQAKAYKDAQGLIGMQKAAPEEYEFGDLQEVIDRDNPHIQELMAYAKENRMQQDAFGKILKTYADYDKSRQPDVDQEIAKVGPDGMQKVQTIQNWVRNNLSKESAAALEQLPVRAPVIKMLDELRQLHANTISRVPTTDQAATAFKLLTSAEVEAEMYQNYKRYQEDPSYRAQITSKFEQAVG